MEKDINSYFTDMDIYVTIRREIIMPQNAKHGKLDNDSVLSLSASTAFPRIGPAKLHDTLLAIKNYAREFNQNVNETLLQCTEKADNGNNESKNSNP